MIILGIDPSNYCLGYAYIDYSLEEKKSSYITHGFVRETVKKFPETLLTQSERLREIIGDRKPHVAVLEAAKDVKGFDSHYKQVQLIGSVKRLLVELKVPFLEIPPSTMKKIATGNGFATKEEVARAMSSEYKIPFEDLVMVTYYKQGIKKGQIKSYLLDGSDALGLANAFPTYYRRVKELEFNG